MSPASLLAWEPSITLDLEPSISASTASSSFGVQLFLAGASLSPFESPLRCIGIGGCGAFGG